MDIKIHRGDVFYANLNPIIGSEQGGIRPVLILQNDLGNKHSTTTIVAPISTIVNKKYLPVHVFISHSTSSVPRNSMVLLEQIRVVDKSRLTQKIGFLNRFMMDEIDRAIKISLGLKKVW